ncbi:Na-K-Cl cotransporter [Aliifodinibius sp. S!AR15-10]|uniref:Na-K-Cl cotransporter n=1 Tax=Aliifodinibius sp. S!AR15-10 TaxID=2950437 RepID=UPI0028657B89|nr:Na-K-Cl cotransporter [Aliifodinibius sp. S!AR15-10]MDR8391993.1 Na-K-Cl cotransporter [Aliifodinibius sp. S!AR15-10]
MSIRERVLPSKEEGLGTFGGVFTPSILTILGVIMYLRFGWVVGNVGLLGTLLVVTISTAITFLTSLSIAAIATDQRVRIGGAYYMISRSLGIESGGAIGVPLYFAQALSVALYTVGFAESVVGVFPLLDEKIVGIITTLSVAALALISAKVAIRAQYFIMFGIALSLLSLLFGSPIEQSTIEMWGAANRHSEPFWTVFAVFFPAVTGIMAGVNMSGDLKDPSRSIPRGTFAAIGVGYVIYMGLPIILANRADALTLIEDPLIMRKIAFWGDAILIGVWGATLSSAVGSILGAPRVLQALARDNILPQSLRWLGKGAGNDDTPRLGTLLTLGVALTAVWFGDLNIIAPILTMFFLTTYGVLNIAAGVERFLGSPSFRPKFKVHWSLSLLGAVGCVAVMFLINTFATIVAVLFVVAIFLWLESRELVSAWGDIRRGIWMAITRAGLLRLGENIDPKNWRPNPLVLSGAPTRRWHLIDLASTLTHNKGIMTISTVLTSDQMTTERKQKMESNIQDYLSKRAVQGLVRVMSADDPFEGAERMVEAYGLGALVPNTIILGDSENPEVRKRYCQMIKRFHDLQRNVLIVRKGKGKPFGNRKRIDLWWGGLKGNGGLMMILAYLLQSSIKWRGADVYLKMVVDSEKAAEDARQNIEHIVDRIRTGSKVEIIISDDRTFENILRESSADADLVLMGMAEPKDNFHTYYEALQDRVKDLPTTILVRAAEEIQFGEVLIQQDTMAE